MADNIENFNKKAIYILIRERTGLKTQNITKVINIMRRDFAKMLISYQQSGLCKRTRGRLAPARSATAAASDGSSEGFAHRANMCGTLDHSDGRGSAD